MVYQVPEFFKTADILTYDILKDLAKENRKYQTPAEAALWSQLKGSELGARFRRQYIVLDYIADFICLEKKLIVEVDGGYHAQAKQIQHDAYRTEELAQYGYRVIRFSNEEVIGDIERVVDVIKKEISSNI